MSLSRRATVRNVVLARLKMAGMKIRDAMNSLVLAPTYDLEFCQGLISWKSNSGFYKFFEIEAESVRTICDRIPRHKIAQNNYFTALWLI